VLMKKNQIRIIKHAGRNDSRVVGVDKKPARVRNRREETKRDAISVVTEWISELRRKKARDVTLGFQSLFGKSDSQLD
jgi:hypothetical protein